MSTWIAADQQLETMKWHEYALTADKFDQVGSGWIAHGFGVPFRKTIQYYVYDGTNSHEGPLTGVLNCASGGGACTQVEAKKASRLMSVYENDDGTSQILVNLDGRPHLLRARP